VRSRHAADHSLPSRDAIMEAYSYTSTHPLGHTGPVTGSLYLIYIYEDNHNWLVRHGIWNESYQNAYIYIYIYIYIWNES